MQHMYISYIYGIAYTILYAVVPRCAHRFVFGFRPQCTDCLDGRRSLRSTLGTNAYAFYFIILPSLLYVHRRVHMCVAVAAPQTYCSVVLALALVHTSKCARETNVPARIHAPSFSCIFFSVGSVGPFDVAYLYTCTPVVHNTTYMVARCAHANERATGKARIMLRARSAARCERVCNWWNG